MCDLIVLAQYTEDIRWAYRHFARVVTYTKSVGNFGRESSSYLRFIIDSYHSNHSNTTQVCFSQGEPGRIQFKRGPIRAPNTISNHQYQPIFNSRKFYFDTCARPHACLPCLAPIAHSIGLRVPSSAYFGAFFTTSIGNIRKTPSEVWWYLYNLHYIHPECNVAFVLERMWQAIMTQSPRLQYNQWRERLTDSRSLLSKLPNKKCSKKVCTLSSFHNNTFQNTM